VSSVKYDYITFKFCKPLTPEQESWFIAYFKDLKDGMKERMEKYIANSTDKSNIFFQLQDKLNMLGGGHNVDMSFILRGKIQFILQSYNRHIMLDKNNPVSYTFYVETEAFEFQKTGVKYIDEQVFTLYKTKNKHIILDIQRFVLPKMGLKAHEMSYNSGDKILLSEDLTKILGSHP